MMTSEATANATEWIDLVKYSIPGITAIAGSVFTGVLTGVLAIRHQRIREDREDRRSRVNHQRELEKLAEKTTDKREDMKYAEAKEAIIEHASAATRLFEEALHFRSFIADDDKTSRYYKASGEFDRARTRFSDAEARLKFILPNTTEDMIDIVGQTVRLLSDPMAERSMEESNAMMADFGDKTRELHNAVHEYLDLLYDEPARKTVPATSQ